MQSLSSVTSNEEFSTGAVILEGHRIFAFPGYAEVCTTVVYLAATDKLLIERETDSGSIRKHKLFISKCTGPTAGAQKDDHSGRRQIAGLFGVSGFTNHPLR